MKKRASKEIKDVAGEVAHDMINTAKRLSPPLIRKSLEIAEEVLESGGCLPKANKSNKALNAQLDQTKLEIAKLADRVSSISETMKTVLTIWDEVQGIKDVMRQLLEAGRAVEQTVRLMQGDIAAINALIEEEAENRGGVSGSSDEDAASEAGAHEVAPAKTRHEQSCEAVAPVHSGLEQSQGGSEPRKRYWLHAADAAALAREFPNERVEPLYEWVPDSGPGDGTPDPGPAAVRSWLADNCSCRWCKIHKK